MIIEGIKRVPLRLDLSFTRGGGLDGDFQDNTEYIARISVLERGRRLLDHIEYSALTGQFTAQDFFNLHREADQLYHEPRDNRVYTANFNGKETTLYGFGITKLSYIPHYPPEGTGVLINDTSVDRTLQYMMWRKSYLFIPSQYPEVIVGMYWSGTYLIEDKTQTVESKPVSFGKMPEKVT